MTKFIYYYEKSQSLSKSTFYISIPSDIETEKELFAILAEKGEFPYFGYNWDALAECLSDFEWLEEKYNNVEIFHEELPFFGDTKLQKIYIETLIDASENLNLTNQKINNIVNKSELKKRKLQILFPNTSEEIINRIFENLACYKSA